MADLDAIVSNVEAFLKKRLDGAHVHSAIKRIRDAIAELVSNPSTPVKKTIISLLEEFQIPNSVAQSLAKSIETGIIAARQGGKQGLDANKMDFALVKKYGDLVTARFTEQFPRLSFLKKEDILSLLEQNTVPLSHLVGSNIAEALLLADPAGVVSSEGMIVEFLFKDRPLDPIEVANCFKELSDERRTVLVRIISDRITTAKEGARSRENALVQSNQGQDWMEQTLARMWLPKTLQQPIASIILQNYSIQQLINMQPRALRVLVSDIVKSYVN